VRYRIRFLLQEFDLPRGTTIIGRSLDCNLTIEDPLVSRQHAQIVIDDDGARVEDLGSRNGVRVNGALISRPAVLRDGDRVRVGTQDLVICGVGASGKAHSKTTGVLRLCAKCRLPYARELFSCPHCAATEQTDEGTLSTNPQDYRAQWSAQLIVEALERAFVLGRLGDAERIGRRAMAQLDELVLSGTPVDATGTAAVSAKMAAMTVATGDPKWALWVLNLYRRTGWALVPEVVDRLADALAQRADVLGEPLKALLDVRRAATADASPDESDAMDRLEKAAHRVDRNVPVLSPRGDARRRSESPGRG
jgi:hypothetical protein